MGKRGTSGNREMRKQPLPCSYAPHVPNPQRQSRDCRETRKSALAPLLPIFKLVPHGKIPRSLHESLSFPCPMPYFQVSLKKNFSLQPSGLLLELLAPWM
jgi:hypothetical protein